MHVYIYTRLTDTYIYLTLRFAPVHKKKHGDKLFVSKVGGVVHLVKAYRYNRLTTII